MMLLLPSPGCDWGEQHGRRGPHDGSLPLCLRPHHPKLISDSELLCLLVSLTLAAVTWKGRVETRRMDRTLSTCPKAHERPPFVLTAILWRQTGWGGVTPSSPMRKITLRRGPETKVIEGPRAQALQLAHSLQWRQLSSSGSCDCHDSSAHVVVSVLTLQFVDIGIVTSIEVNHKQVDVAKKGQEVCVKIEPIPGESPKMYGRHFEATDIIVSKVSISLSKSGPFEERGPSALLMAFYSGAEGLRLESDGTGFFVRAWPVAWPPDRVPARTSRSDPQQTDVVLAFCSQKMQAGGLCSGSFCLSFLCAEQHLVTNSGATCSSLALVCYIVLFTLCLGPYRSAGSPSTPSKTGSETKCRRVTGS